MRRLFAILALMITAFVVVPATAANADPGPGPWRLKNKLSGMCLNQDYSGGVAHATVLAWPCSATPAANEKWAVLSGKQYQNVASGKCLDQDYSGGVEHANIIVYTCTAAANSSWGMYNTELSNTMLINGMSNKCLNQDYSGGVPHHTMLAYDCIGKPEYQNNFWELVRV